MRVLLKLLIPIGIVAALSGCVVAQPYGYYRGYYPRVAIVAPAPVVVVRPFH